MGRRGVFVGGQAGKKRKAVNKRGKRGATMKTKWEKKKEESREAGNRVFPLGDQQNAWRGWEKKKS